MSTRVPGVPAGAMSDALAALVARLRDAGVVPDVEELADALWLARHLPGADRPRDPASAAPPYAAPAPAADAHRMSASAGAYGTVTAGSPERQPDGARLFAPVPAGDSAGVRAAPVSAPAAPVLPEPLALQRGLRPLQRYRAPVRPVPRTLDERATAEQAAESGIVLPVLRTERRREARLLLLMDVSTSTVVWQQVLDELRQVCERAGAFREVQVQYLHEAPGGLPGYAAAPERAGPLHAPEQLSDPTGRRLTLVLSDCAGPMWRSGRMQRLLHRWASTAPVAVIQPLPQRMWMRTHLPARRGMLRRREGPAGTLEFRPDRGRVERGALPVPVLALRRGSVEGWARLVSGTTGQSLAAAAGWVHADHPESRAPVRATEDVSGTDRVRAFWRAASPEARRLAVYLSAVPLYLPVMQLVQHAMLAGSGPEALSEVLLGGLLRRREDANDPRAVRYDFLPGVAVELRSRLTLDEAQLLFKHCSEYVDRKFGRSARNFPALAGAFLRGAVDPDAQGPPVGPVEDEPSALRAFAEVSAAVLRDLGARIPAAPKRPELTAAELLGRGRKAIGRFEGEGLTRELDAAIRYLHQAVEASAQAPERLSAAEELANALLVRWRVRRVGDDLRDAWEAIRAPDRLGAPGSLTRGLVCWALAGELGGRGLDFEGVPPGLREWARGAADGRYRAEEFARAVLLYVADRDLSLAMDGAGSCPEGLNGPRTAAAALPYVRRAVAEAGADHPGADGPYRAPDAEQWYLAHLHRAVDAADVRLAFPSRERAQVVRGQLLLDLARQYAGDGRVRTARPLPERAAELAVRAMDDFRVAARGRRDLSDEERCRAWLAVASAREFVRPPDDEERERQTLYAVDQALRAAGEDLALRRECYARAARIYRGVYDRTRDGEQLDRAVEAWAQAERLLDDDDLDRAGLLYDYGTALMDRSTARGSADDAVRAVTLLRTALQETPPGHPAVPFRWAGLAQAHLRRYTIQHVPSDLHEAEWTMGEAIRSSEDPGFLARCWMTRASMLALLHVEVEGPSYLDRAIEAYGHTAGHARRAGLHEELAEALEERARLTGRADDTTPRVRRRARTPGS
ncbi:SAV_2336 N-terminal domain-related protein [Streptomyces sp. NPDC052023]|uniref:SAV_2336 N-terminal domain-related protein n=1 Tax=Streptomyces sp. NPDC052023 TaxID=3365681 RepID=UPI0037D7D6F3